MMPRDDSLASEAAFPTVQLRHELADGSSHIDWLLGQDAAGARLLVSFRIDRPVSDLDEGQWLIARRMADHRPMYLDYEGPVSGDRGHVARLCRGRIIAWEKTRPGRWEIEIRWEMPAGVEVHQQLRLRRQDLERWEVFLRPQGGPLR